jgi:oligopeptide transport system substrate-binding protein
LFVSDGGNNRTAWSNTEYDRVIKSAANCADPAARLELFQTAETLLLEEAPVVPLVHTARVYLIHPSVKGWEPSLMAIPRYQLVSMEN